ncbi:aldehyde dehydrogenase [Mycolicibacterium pyrenivorans]|uniref:aldehyde dehydrogenase n=1 Tax=Mycolicibacterium pyrenivorans TaxID=187102 RepID=UPI0021F2A6DD|nr:aldehyde dehydrogenase [Mycolicibacterium pyrenivorans]MCV7149962.1 aldehyde dehydrogenase [Mycolicibacterium pyrenivorans]
MAIASGPAALLKNTDCLFLGGEWAEPSTRNKIRVSDSTTEEIFLEVAEAQADDMSRAVGAARAAFDHGPWPRMKHAERAVYLRAIAEYLLTRGEDIGQIWPRETGALQSVARAAGQDGFDIFTYYADQADTFGWVKPMTPTFGGAGFLIREPVGVVGAIIPWNSPMRLIGYKVAPALIAGCTVVLKASPEAPAEAYIFAEAVEAAGLPPGVVNVITADREVSELLVRDPRVDKITFTGSTAAGRTIGSICGERVARCTLELGGKSAAVILNDVDIAKTATHLMRQECLLTGQSCSSLTRVIVPVKRHDEMLEALAAEFRGVRVGDPFEPDSQIGPLVSARQRDRVEYYIAKGIESDAILAAGGKRPDHLPRGYYIEPTVFGNVDNSSVIAQEEIFGPVVSVIPAVDEDHAVELANDSIFGLNASVFTDDVERAIDVAKRLRAGTVGHNAFRTDFGIAFGGFKQSGIGREGGTEGILPFTESKTLILKSKSAVLS